MEPCHRKFGEGAGKPQGQSSAPVRRASRRYRPLLEVQNIGVQPDQAKIDESRVLEDRARPSISARGVVRATKEARLVVPCSTWTLRENATQRK